MSGEGATVVGPGLLRISDYGSPTACDRHGLWVAGGN